MKKLLVLSAALAVSALSLAQEVGRVISSTPIMGQVAVPRNVCTTEQVAVQQPKSGAGAVMGAIAGGAMGNAVGGGGGKTVATMLGIFGGAVLGDRVEGAATPQVQNVQRCATHTVYENRPLAYSVVYEFVGKQYSVQMPNDPGPTLQLQITPIGANPPWMEPQGSAPDQPPGYAPPARVMAAPPVYPGYDARPYYPPVRVEVETGYGEGHRGRRHWQ